MSFKNLKHWMIMINDKIQESFAVMLVISHATIELS